MLNLFKQTNLRDVYTNTTSSIPLEFQHNYMKTFQDKELPFLNIYYRFLYIIFKATLISNS